jgi:glycosyltransferase involved in cell wall biosynthesis
LLEAVVQLKEKYPDIVIAAAGYNPIQKPLPQKELKDSSYIRYIKSLIKKYDLQDHIELLGELSEERMKEEYLKANVFVMPSTIENSPNSMAEAMMLGVPTVASDVGGVTDFAKHQEEAYIYPSSATYLLAHYIDKVFSDKADAEIIGNKGKLRAEIEYNRENNIKRFEEIMSIIAKSG